MVQAKLLAAAGLCAVVDRLIVLTMPNDTDNARRCPGRSPRLRGRDPRYPPTADQDIEKLRGVVLSLPRPLRPAAHAGLQLIVVTSKEADNA